jgi:hypothetical protein
MDTRTKISRARHALVLGVLWASLGLSYAALAAPGPEAPPLDGVTFADEPGTLYAPARRLAQALEWPIHWEAETRTLSLQNRTISAEHQRSLVDGTRLVAVRALRDMELTVAWNPDENMARITGSGADLRVRRGEKRIAISLDAQQMRAWQGEYLVLDTRVSTGRPGMETPTGSFEAGPLKTELLISRTYGNARMPWSVQIQGDYVIHGFQTVPPRSASHGCVRVPLTGGNPARWFYQWVEIGTPIIIADGWPPDLPPVS